MSDVMLKGVLRMPRHMAMGDAVSSFQFYDRAQEALDRMERAEAALMELVDSLDAIDGASFTEEKLNRITAARRAAKAHVYGVLGLDGAQPKGGA